MFVGVRHTNAHNKKIHCCLLYCVIVAKLNIYNDIMIILGMYNSCLIIVDSTMH